MFKPKKFNKKKYTLKRKVNSKELKKLLGKNYKNPNLNLDIDFSVSKGGYRLRPHRDDVNRLYNFLIYCIAHKLKIHANYLIPKNAVDTGMGYV